MEYLVANGLCYYGNIVVMQCGSEILCVAKLLVGNGI